MRVGRVIGKVVLSERNPNLPNGRWLLVSPLNREGLSSPDKTLLSNEPSLVVYDNLGAGENDLIGFSEGGEAMKPFPRPTPVDATCAAILNNLSYQPSS
jgi:carbon dioxide concentrating mechanism protein CcmL